MVNNIRVRIPKSAFQIAVENTEEVKNGFCLGIKAIKNADRSKIVATDPKKLQGSLDIDTQVKNLYPDDPRWDYALSYDNKIYYFEVHPVETSEIKKVIDKVRWLKSWLNTKAKEINKLSKAEHPYLWVQSGRYALLPTGNDMKKLSVAGIFITKTLKLR